MAEHPGFFDLTRPELKTWFTERGHPPYRARQVFLNVYQRGVTDFQAMTDLPKSLRAELAEAFELTGLTESRRVRSAAESTTKFLWRLPDGKVIESVLMDAEYGETICFSTQVGCAFGCTFCTTARMGKLRNLSPGEIVSQILHMSRHRLQNEGRLNLVAMGMGEPMDNLDAVLRAVEILQDDLGMNVSGKRITISTVGVVPGIQRLTRENPSLRLALSLNATTNEVRRELMPVTRKYPLETLLPAVEDYARVSGTRVTLEYVLIQGLNDSPEDADRLGAMAERFPSKVNVIPFNPTELFPHRRPTETEVDAFARRLWRRRTTVTVRYSKGLDILAACGQLGYDQVKESGERDAAGGQGSTS
jgi:23S rRNA (adenine2503-C2)-methyltransferase